MSSVNKEFFRLLKKYRLGKASAAEINFLEQYYEYFDKEAKIGSTFSEEEKTNTSQNLFARIEQQMEQAPVVPIYRRNWFRVAAACIIILLSVSTFLLVKNTSEPTIVKIDDGKSQHDVAAPTISKATITLADGSTVNLDSLNAGTLATQGNVTVTKNANGEIIYNGSQLIAHNSPITFNTLSNPRGSKVVDITLSDGSRAWLNAGSSLTYPVAFMGNERRVSITGEAYFEVAHDVSKPFYVSKGDMNVQVLGTKFNVNAYEDEREIRVTLLEGSVKVATKKSTVMVKPGQQAQISGEVKVVNGADLAVVMSWKNGFFYFKNADIQTIMRQSARWYNVEVVYAGKIPDDTFTGKVPNKISLRQWLKILELSNVKFTLDGRKITVFQ